MEVIETEYKANETFLYKGYLMRSKIPDGIREKKRKTNSVVSEGVRFGRLIVLEELGFYKKGGEYLVGCECDCGNKIAIKSRGLKDGLVKSCGCLNLEMLRSRAGSNKMEVGESCFNQLFYLYKKSARERGYPFELSRDEFRAIVELPCKYCGSHRQSRFKAAKGTFGHFFYTGCDRVNNKLGYTVQNSVPCCKQCNISKGVLGEQEFYDWLKKAYKNIWEKNKN